MGYPNQSATDQRFYYKLRTEILTNYSDGDAPRCANCQIDNVDVLCLDHIVPCGTAGRSPSSKGFMMRLRREGFPPGYQVLCHNCNHLKRLSDYGLGRYRKPPAGR